MRSEDIFQISLIILAVVAATLFGVFLYRELYPEYKIYQKAYVALEDFRSTYTGKPPPPFEFGIKQIVIPKPDKGPETIDRCTSCHVALQYEHFSPTIIERDVNGKVVYDKNGNPEKVENPNFIWAKLDQKVEDLRNEGLNQEADRLAALKTANVGEHHYDMEKVLIMHPLIGRETRPFEYHPIDEYGCTVCHGGNGRGLVTDRAHGPVYDNTYEETYMGPEPQFLEEDERNDPLFSKAYNHKPGHRLLFQTTPLLVGDLIQAKCVQCHTPTTDKLNTLADEVNRVATTKQEQISVIRKGFEQEYNALISLLSLRKFLKDRGVTETLNELRGQSEDYTKPPEVLEQIQGNIDYLRKKIVEAESEPAREKAILEKIDRDLLEILGTPEAVKTVQEAFDQNRDITSEQLYQILQEAGHQGSFQQKGKRLREHKQIRQSVENVQYSVKYASADEDISEGLTTDIDRLTRSYQRGQQLFISQACYACHKISGFSRGGIGPELTEAGMGYPWFIKESIVWPQADLKTSTMPNYRLDHEELEDLMTFLMAQRTDDKSESEVKQKIVIKEWEEGKKQSWEKPLQPSAIRDVRRSMTIFATEGCAACHRLKGFKSNVGFAVEKQDPTFDQLYQESQWFRDLIPEESLGSYIVEAIDKNKEEIDKRIVRNVRENALLDELERKYPDLVESYYSSFKYALRAKNHTGDAEEWKERVYRVLMMYVQEYGLGRLVGPRPNWSGIYRSDKWLMEHFWNPSSLIARSIMPVFPFDNTKFLALTHMLNVLGQRNRDGIREIWTKRGFNAEMAYERLCSQCHGETLKGNGPVSEWIYPIPKSLANPIFLRNLTKDRAVQSLIHGVSGTPMPPWGETAGDKDFANDIPVLTQDEIVLLVNWIYRNLPGEKFLRELEEVKKWQYQPENVLEELKKAGDLEKLSPQSSRYTLPDGEDYLVSLNPMIAAQPPRSVDDIFDKVPNPLGRPDAYHYYIKKKYYTKKNLQEGKEFFELNCAICHGKDADGAGLRSGVMEDAKPRMLINLPWIESRDDLRLIRSLIYGVTGTSMTPWGDQTTALQRLQLVMYIRSLTETKKDYEKLGDLIFQVFQRPVWALQDARTSGSKKIDELQKDLYQARIERLRLEEQVKEGEISPDDIGERYAKELQVVRKLQAYQNEDQMLTRLIGLVEKEKELYQKLGDAIFNLYGDSPLFDDFLKAIKLNQNHFRYEDGKLIMRSVDVEQLRNLEETILKEIEQRIKTLEAEKLVLEGKIPSPEQRTQLQDLKTVLKSQLEMKKEAISTFAQLERLRNQQRSLYKKLDTHHDRSDSE